MTTEEGNFNGVSKIGLQGVASFSVRRTRASATAELIIALIERSVREQLAITRDDIYILYWLYKTENETKSLPPTREFVSGKGWSDINFDKEAFINHWRFQRNSISWFKNGLSSAILEGKLLVLPIIEI